MVVLSLSLAEQPLWGFEVFRPRSILAADARHYAKLEGWQLEPDEDLMIAAGGEGPKQLARRLLGVLEHERPNLVRLAARRQGALLTLALNVPRPDAQQPARVAELARRLAEQAQTVSPF